MCDFSRPKGPLSVSAHRRVDAACVRFEALWQAGQRPVLPEFLAGTAGAERNLLLRELLLLDVHYRRRVGEAPTADDYLAQLPTDDSLLRELLPAAAPSQPSTTGPEVYLVHTDPGPRRRRVPLVQPPGYEILSELGRGGMGVVYKAWQIDLKRYVALKMILDGDYSRPEQIIRFRTEVEAIARLKHPSIVQVHQVGEHRGLPFCVLEYVEGGTLAGKLSERRPPPREAAALVEKIARAVHAMHQCRVMHRDLKPGNVLLTPDGTPKITDFGLAKILDENDSRTQCGDRLGTPSYMAPEQAEGRGADVGPWTDLYALGAMLYECLTGRPPFVASTRKAIYRQISQTDPVPPRKRNPAVPRDLETICLKCLQKEPSQRYATALDLADDLGRYLEGRPIQARPVRAWEQVIKLVRRRPLQVALAGAVAVAVLAVAVGGVCYGLYKDAQNEILEHKLGIRQQAAAQMAQARLAWVIAGAALKQEGRDEETDKQLTRAADHLRAARDLSGGGEGHEEEDEINALLDKVSQARKHLQGRRAFRDRRDRFAREREQVLLFAVSVTGRDETTNRQQILRRARQALADLNVGPDRPAAKAAGALTACFKDHAPRAGLEQLALGCYEVLLVWAEAEASVPADRPEKERLAGARRALRLLEVAEALAEHHALGVSGTHLHARRKRYLQAARTPEAPAGPSHLVSATGQPTALERFLDAREEFSNGRPREAAAACEQVLRQEPSHFWAWFLRALCHFQMGRWGEARVGLDTCLKMRPDFLWARLFRATAHGKLGHAGFAEEDFAAVLARADDPALRYLARTNRGVYWMSSKRAERWALAEDDLNEAIKIRPECYNAYVNLALLHRGRGQRPEALAAISSAIARKPTAPELYLIRARLHAEHDRQAARRDFEEVIAREQGCRHSPRRASACVELASLECKDREYGDALQLCEDALQASPGYPPAHRQRAHILLAQGDHEKAGKELDLYLCASRKANNRPDPDAYRVRGHIHVILREYAEAAVAYTEALAHGLDPDTLFRRGQVYLVLNSPHKAMADFESALKKCPTLGDARCGRAEARLRLGQILLAAEDAEAALKTLKENGESSFWAARFYARAFRSLQEASGGRPVSAGLVVRFRERALDLLQDSLEGLPREKRKEFWRDSVRGSVDLASLRDSSRFLSLASTYGRR